MEKNAFISKLEYRTSAANAQHIANALGESLIEKLHFVKDGLSTSVFEISDSNLVLKISDRRLEKNKRIDHSRFMLRGHAQVCVADDNALPGQASADVILDIKPKLTHEGVTRLHQEMLRYQMWTQEGLEFWDHYPASSNRMEVKNVMLDHRGVPYQIDEDAVRKFDDRYNEYPPGDDGKRSDAQYLHMRANSWNQYGSPDALDQNEFKHIKAACEKCEWPVNQSGIFTQRTYHQIVAQFKDAFATLTPQLTSVSR